MILASSRERFTIGLTYLRPKRYAMTDPAGFSTRMQGLDTVPDPLWWLLGAIVSFYFGARELHYQRRKTNITTNRPKTLFLAPSSNPGENAALSEWRALNK